MIDHQADRARQVSPLSQQLTVHPALERARTARLAEDSIQAAPPHELWRLCGGDGALYSHAMEEAGHLTVFPEDGSQWVPTTPCSRCGWQPLTATVAIVSYKTPALAEHLRRSIGQPRWLRALHSAENGEGGANIGYAAALQVMFGYSSRTPVLIACNADVEFPPQDITPLLELFNEHPRLGVLGPRQRDPRGYLVHGGILEPGSPGGGREYGQADVGQLTERYAEVAQVSGSVMLIRRAAYEQVGGMKNMPRLYYEDAIFCHRLRKAGWEVGYSGLLTFTHRLASSPSDQRSVFAEEGRAAWERETADVRPQLQEDIA